VLAPFLGIYVEPPLARQFGWLPLFQGPITGIGLFTGGVILAIMVTPIISAVARDVLSRAQHAAELRSRWSDKMGKTRWLFS